MRYLSAAGTPTCLVSIPMRMPCGITEVRLMSARTAAFRRRGQCSSITAFAQSQINCRSNSVFDFGVVVEAKGNAQQSYDDLG